MKSPKIIKNIETAAKYFTDETGILLKPSEYEPVRDILVSVFNAGKNGIVDPEIEADFDQFYSVLYPNRKARPKALKAYIKARAKVSKEIIHAAVTKQRPEMLKIRDENKVKGEKNLGKHILHPATWLTDEHWNDEVETYTPTAREEVKVKHILTVEEIMTSKQGQYALEKGVGGVLLSFVQSNKKYPTENEFRGLYNIAKIKAEQPLKDEIDIKCAQVSKEREQNLKDEYLKDK